jgi:GntR family histidine utilization transcriptional repressor
VWAVDSLRDAALTLEAAGDLPVARQRRVEPLDRDPSARVVAAFVHRTVRAAAQRADQRVGPKRRRRGRDRRLLTRRRRAGSFVAEPPSDSTMLDIPDIQADLQQRGKAYSYRLLKRHVRAPLKTRQVELDLARGGEILEVVSLHSSDGKPYAHECRLISLEAVPNSRTADFSVSPPGSWLLDHVPWSQAEHRISAIPADAEMTALLDVPDGSPCLLLERRTWHDQSPVTYVRQTFPGDRHSFVGAFSHTT